MSSIENTMPPKPASLFTLFSPRLLPATLMLGGGVTLYAVEAYIMARLHLRSFGISAAWSCFPG